MVQEKRRSPPHSKVFGEACDFLGRRQVVPKKRREVVRDESVVGRALQIVERFGQGLVVLDGEDLGVVEKGIFQVRGGEVGEIGGEEGLGGGLLFFLLDGEFFDLFFLFGSESGFGLLGSGFEEVAAGAGVGLDEAGFLELEEAFVGRFVDDDDVVFEPTRGGTLLRVEIGREFPHRFGGGFGEGIDDEVDFLKRGV